MLAHHRRTAKGFIIMMADDDGDYYYYYYHQHRARALITMIKLCGRVRLGTLLHQPTGCPGCPEIMETESSCRVMPCGAVIVFKVIMIAHNFNGKLMCVVLTRVRFPFLPNRPPPTNHPSCEPFPAGYSRVRGIGKMHPALTLGI